MPINHLHAQRFGRLELLAKQNVEGFITGLHRSPYHGFSVEFAEHRAYNSGESTRHLDWKLYGRTDKMYVKRYEEETNLRCHLLIDQSASMLYPRQSVAGVSKLQFAIQSAASLAYLMRSQRDAVGLTTFGKHIDFHAPAKSSARHHSFLFQTMESLYDLPEGSKESDIAGTLHIMAERMHQRSMLVVFSDFMDSALRGSENQKMLFEALQHLRYNKHEVILFHLFDRATEVNLELENRPYTMVDMETGEKIRVMPREVQAQYHALREQRIHEVKLHCRHYGIDWNACDIAEGVMPVLDQFLAKRQRLG